MNDTDIRQLVTMLQHLPPSLPDNWYEGKPSLTEGKMICKCGKLKDIRELEPLDTGVIHVINNVCKNCTEAVKEDRSLARVVCCCCKQVVARMAPHKSPLGFEFERNRTYHVDKCAVCHPGLKESLILEELLYNRAQGRGRLKA